jgi:hypothetical protein
MWVQIPVKWSHAILRVTCNFADENKNKLTMMKFYFKTMLVLATLMLCSCSSDNNDVMAQTMTQKMNITIDNVTKSVTLVDNAAARALVARLQESPVSVTLNSSGGFEIWGALGFSLPTSNEQITAQPGDVILYNGSNICLFYGSNSWSYTRLGHIDGLTEAELRTFLHAGESNIKVMLWLPVGTIAQKGDLNEDGEVTIADVTTLIELLLGSGNKG